MQGDVLAGRDLLLDLGDLVPKGLLVLVDVVVVEMFLHLKQETEKNIPGMYIEREVDTFVLQQSTSWW